MQSYLPPPSTLHPPPSTALHPPSQVNEKAIKPAVAVAKEKVVEPLMIKAGPLIEQGKSKLNEVLASKGVGVPQQVVAEEEDNL